MRNEINNLLPHLNSDEDWLLIDLLNLKLNKLLFSKHNPHFTQKELSMTESGLFKQISNYLNENTSKNVKYLKAEKILSNNSCDTCKYAIKETRFYKDLELNLYCHPNRGNAICESCINRCDKLHQIIDNSDLDIKCSVNSVISDDVLKTKALINKLQRKIKQICAQ